MKTHKRCEDCKYFHPTVFIGEGEHGFPVWEGHCLCHFAEVKNTFFACPLYEKKERGKNDG